LLTAGADINARDKHENTALIHAVWMNKNPEVTITLLKGGANVNIKNKAGRTALIAASHRSHPELTRLLLKAGADVNARTQRDETALMWAVRSYPMLIEDAEDDDGKTKDIAALIDVEANSIISVLNLLLTAGADINAQDNNGKSPLMWSCDYDKPQEIITALLEYGADAKLKDNAGFMAIDYAEKNPKLRDMDILQKLR
jgi:ankyrin repeat protein